MSKNPIAELFMKEERAKASMYRAKDTSSPHPEAKEAWKKMADLCEQHAFIFELQCI